MSHPETSRIALYAGGDLGFLDRLRIGHHLRGCPGCRASLAGYRQARERLRAACAELPEGLNWDRLAAEMTGNIRVGLAAGECVGRAKPGVRHLTWKPVLAALGLSVIVASGWWLNFPSEQRQFLAQGIQRIWHRDSRVPVDNSVYLDSNRVGIQFKENGSAMTLMHPDAAPTVVSVSTQGSMRARYIDSDTGQVTITNVYAQ